MAELTEQSKRFHRDIEGVFGEYSQPVWNEVESLRNNPGGSPGSFLPPLSMRVNAAAIVAGNSCIECTVHFRTEMPEVGQTVAIAVGNEFVRPVVVDRFDLQFIAKRQLLLQTHDRGALVNCYANRELTDEMRILLHRFRLLADLSGSSFRYEFWPIDELKAANELLAAHLVEARLDWAGFVKLFPHAHPDSLSVRANLQHVERLRWHLHWSVFDKHSRSPCAEAEGLD